MKKLFLIILFLLTASPVWAANTYYLRSDGGAGGGVLVGTNCNGLFNVSLATATSAGNINCAFNHPVYAIGARGATSGPGNGVMSGGDTLIVRSLNGATQEQFMLGYGMPVVGPTCNTSSTPNCRLKNIPSGIVGQRTRILGDQWDTGCSKKPQFWGTEAAINVLEHGENVEIQCLEVTDHSACVAEGPTDGSTDGFPTRCADRNGPYPHGPYAMRGITLVGTADNIYYKNLYVHGVGVTAIEVHSLDNTPNISFGDITLENSDLISASKAGFDTQAASHGTGTVTFLNTNVEWIGCGEHYPLVTTQKDSSLNMHHCFDQQMGGYGDGVAFGRDQNNVPTGSSVPGNWVFKGGSFSFNASDGIDTLHGDSSSGSFLASRVRIEGNVGQPIKAVGNPAIIENSLIITDCGFFYGQTFTSTKDINGSSSSMDLCRASDGVPVFAGVGKVFKAYNNTLLFNQYVSGFTVYGTTCDATSVLDIRNNIVYGGRRFRDDSALFTGGGDGAPNFIYFGGTNGNGGGTCLEGSNLNPINTNNVVYLMSNSNSPCLSGTNNICGSDPLFTGTIKQGPYPSPGYYSGTDYANQIYIQTTSPAKNAGSNSLTYTNGSADFNNFPRSGIFDIGALEFGSVPSESCFDGIQNQDETAIDCGGTICPSCTVSPVCGNGTREPPTEICDLSDLGGQDCNSQGFTGGGTLACAPNCLSFNTSSCVSAGGGATGTTSLWRGLLRGKVF